MIFHKEEWLVRRVGRTSKEACLFTDTGLSKLIRNREARFINTIERKIDQAIKGVDPKTTERVREIARKGRNVATVWYGPTFPVSWLRRVPAQAPKSAPPLPLSTIPSPPWREKD